MLSIFRRLINSRVGVVVSLAFLVLMAVLFGLPGFTGVGSGGRATGDAAARVAGKDVSVQELRQRAETGFAQAQQQQPGLTLPAYVLGGGIEGSLDEIVNGLALAAFGQKQGMVISRRAEDGEIASLPQLQNAAGQFDQSNYELFLKQANLTDAGFRATVRQSILGRMLIAPTLAPQPVAPGFAAAYAALLLEKREGTVGIIPSSAVPAGPAPGEPEVASYYASHRAQYVVPERRAVRYVLVTPEALAARATPSDADLAAEYAARRAEFAPAQKRDVTAVTVLDQKDAAALAAKASGGADLSAAARTAGLEPRALGALTQADLAKQTSPAIAAAAFAAPAGGVVGPVRGPVGFIVAKVGAVQQVSGKTLAEARPELVKSATARKTTALLTGLRTQADDALNAKANFNEVAGKLGLPVVASAPLTAGGIDPDHLADKPDPRLGPVIAGAFQAAPGDPPGLAPLGPDGSFALVSLDRVVAPAPPPLAKIHDQVARDVQAEHQQAAARKIAGTVLAKVNAGTPLAQALTATGLKLPTPKPVTAARGQLTAQGGRVPPLLALMFSGSMGPGTTRLLEMPGNAGWYLIRLDKVTPGDAHADPTLTARIGGEFAKLVGREEAEQFARAVQGEVGVSRNPSAIAQLKAELTGQSGRGGPNP